MTLKQGQEQFKKKYCVGYFAMMRLEPGTKNDVWRPTKVKRIQRYQFFFRSLQNIMENHLVSTKIVY